MVIIVKDVLEKIYDYSLEEIMGKSFGRYSKYIIQDRAIPDVRDGLKPVQRRILYSMYKERNTYDKPYRKSAKTVGDVIGNYHPHGDTSIYDAMVRMSQNWKLRSPYIDMHGNNGSIDGDSAAAYRYTEARLSKISNELLRDIDQNTVEFAPNFDDSALEPTVLPCKYPNLLVNGTTGISAGYATNIPPHNLGEVVDACIYRLDSPNCRLDSIMNIVKGPDFPTGGIIEGIDGIRTAYETGKGKIVVKAKTRIEKNKIIVSEIPYEVNKALLVKKIDEIRIDKKIDGILEVRDETDRNGLQITIDLKKDANAEFILNYLFKNTELQTSYAFNMVVIVNRRPMLLGILGMLDAYIAHQKEVVHRRCEYSLEHAKSRYHIVEGLIKAISILDDVIKTIRSSKNKADAIENLVKQFDFTNEQATAIVTLQLYRLTNTDVTLLEEELSSLMKLIHELNEILSNPEKLNSVIKNELREIKKQYSLPRLTQIKEEVEEIKIDNTMMMPREDVVVVVTKEGYIKRVSLRSYASKTEESTVLKENDYLLGLFTIHTLDTILLFTNLGNYLYLPVYDIPELKWKDLGKHISNIIPLSSEEKIIQVIPVYDFNKPIYITSFSKNGFVKRSSLADFKVQRYSKPMSMMKLKDNDEVVSVTDSPLSNVLVVTKNGYGLRYKTEEISILGVKAAGVKSINLKEDEVISGILFDDIEEYVTLITDKGTGKRLKLSEIPMGSRANRGLLLMKEIKSNPSKMNSAYVMNHKNSILVITDNEMKKVKLTEIPIMDRYSNGSYLVKNRIVDTAYIVEMVTKEDKQDIENYDSILHHNEEIISIQESSPIEDTLEEKKEDKEEVSSIKKVDFAIYEEGKLVQEELDLDDIDRRIMTIDDLLRGIDKE